jgi:two-component system, NarL family, nitrate/nitrite response regulator NarL
MELTCLIVDDNLAFLRAASARLAPNGVSVVGLASSGDEAVLLAEKLRPALALVDIQLGGESGFDVARRLAATERPPRVILISVLAEDDMADMLGDAPVAGFLPKQRLSARAIRQILDGEQRGPRAAG